MTPWRTAPSGATTASARFSSPTGTPGLARVGAAALIRCNEAFGKLRHAAMPAACGLPQRQTPDHGGRSTLRRQVHIVHEQRVDAGLAECHDRIGGRADDRLAVVEGRVDDERHAGLRMETGYQ